MKTIEELKVGKWYRFEYQKDAICYFKFTTADEKFIRADIYVSNGDLYSRGDYSIAYLSDIEKIHREYDLSFLPTDHEDLKLQGTNMFPIY